MTVMEFQLILLTVLSASVTVMQPTAAASTASATVAVPASNNSAEEQFNDYVNLTLNCLQQTSKGNDGSQVIAKVKYFSAWELEEIPCFTRCLLGGKGYFDIAHNKWNKKLVAEEVGEDVYNYCRFELAREEGNGCEIAHRGLRCMQQAEQNLKRTKSQLLECVEELHVDMKQLQEYADSKEPEEIPCLFKCLAERMNFYTPEYEWNFDNWIKAFGPMKHDTDAAFACKANAHKIRTLQPCTWMYEEYACLERLNYNSYGSENATSTTLQSHLESEAMTTTTTKVTVNQNMKEQTEQNEQLQYSTTTEHVLTV